jgi:hypothetical protein
MTKASGRHRTCQRCRVEFPVPAEESGQVLPGLPLKRDDSTGCLADLSLGASG